MYPEKYSAINESHVTSQQKGKQIRGLTDQQGALNSFSSDLSPFSVLFLTHNATLGFGLGLFLAG